MTLETFFEKFDQFAAAPDAVARMRELVLNLAVQGKLVDQVPSDESAIMLLKRIRDTKERLSSERVIKRLDIDPIAKDEAPFSIPETWIWTRLGQIGDWGSGSTPARGNHALYDGGVTWLKSGELNDNQALAGSEETVTEIALKTCSFRRNQPGDVLLAMYGATIGKVAILKESAVTNQAICGCTPFDGVFNRYLFNFLLSQRLRFHAASEGGAQPNISKEKIVNFPCPLPPLAEQKRIVAKVDELMALCDRLEAQQQERKTQHATLARASLARFSDAPTPANLHLLFHKSYTISPADLRKSILTLAVQSKLVPQDPNDEPPQIPSDGPANEDSEWVSRLLLPDTWLWARFESLLAVLKNGFNGKPSKVVGKFKITRIETIARQTIDLARVGYAEDLPSEIVAKHNVMKGDILFSHINSEPHLGKTAICTFNDPTLVHGVNLLLLRPIAGIDSGYLNIALRELRTSGYFVSIAQRAVNQASINQKNLGKTPIPVPPLAEQRRIVAKVDQLMSLVDELDTQLAASRATASNLLEAIVAELTAA